NGGSAESQAPELRHPPELRHREPRSGVAIHRARAQVPPRNAIVSVERIAAYPLHEQGDRSPQLRKILLPELPRRPRPRLRLPLFRLAQLHPPYLPRDRLRQIGKLDAP